MEIFEQNPHIGRYELYGTKPNGEKFPVAKVENGKVEVFDRSSLAELRNKDKAEAYIQNLRGMKIDDAEIARISKDLPNGEWKNSVISTLSKYKGLTWEEAIVEHGRL